MTFQLFATAEKGEGHTILIGEYEDIEDAYIILNKLLKELGDKEEVYNKTFCGDGK